MVVVSGSWVKNVVAYPSPTMSNNSLVGDLVMNMNLNNNNNNMNGNGTINGSGNNNNGSTVTNGKTNCAKAVLICRPNSHPFQERTLLLDQPVKVGRSVVRARATSTNAIFDCKVLSRHHALLWYDSGKFYLQDTKSSNGTFVNNNRLSTNESEPHELNSGDIVQFGVDVVENNRQVTHGCIVANIRLYLPDGKEAKASPSITEGNRHGMVPLDELYKLNQIIQEASQRELCLETKLSALQQVVEKAKKSADDSWQAYVGEERLLSKVSALESQLNQAGKTMNDERLREELTKLQEDSIAYQVAAKKTLDRLHNEKLEAIALASEEQRARTTAEQEAILAKEQLQQIQLELQDIAHKLVEEQKKADDEKLRLEQREQELLQRLETDAQTISELQEKLNLTTKSTDGIMPLEQLEKYSVIYEFDKMEKGELLGENEITQADLNKSNSMHGSPNHITFSVAPVSDSDDENKDLDKELSPSSRPSLESCSTLMNDSESDRDDNDNAKETPERIVDYERTGQEQAPRNEVMDSSLSKEKHEAETEHSEQHVDSKTLKYQFQSMQSELKKQIEVMEGTLAANQARIYDLEDELKEQNMINSMRASTAEKLKEELTILETKYKEISNEAQQLKDKHTTLLEDLKRAEDIISAQANKSIEKHTGEGDNIDVAHNVVNNNEQIASLEEELVILKEKYVQLHDEKTVLNNTLSSVRDEYNALCNRNHNQMFMYIAPLVLMVLYLLISSMFS